MIGIYGVMAYSVSQRTHEIGIRMALGAHRATSCERFCGKARVLLFWGGNRSRVALALSRAVAGLLFGVQATDPVTFAVVATLLGPSRWRHVTSPPDAPRVSTRWSRCATNDFVVAGRLAAGRFRPVTVARNNYEAIAFLVSAARRTIPQANSATANFPLRCSRISSCTSKTICAPA